MSHSTRTLSGPSGTAEGWKAWSTGRNSGWASVRPPLRTASIPDFDGRSAAPAGADRSAAASATGKPPSQRERSVFIALIECDLVPKVLRPRRQKAGQATRGRKGGRAYV